MSASRQKGTRFENKVAERYLTQVWPEAHRAAQHGTLDFGDFEGVNGWLIEAKWRASITDWRIPAWVRAILHKREARDPTAPWLLVFSADQRKRSTPSCDLVVMPADQYFAQLAELVRLRHGDGKEVA